MVGQQRRNQGRKVFTKGSKGGPWAGEGVKSYKGRWEVEDVRALALCLLGRGAVAAYGPESSFSSGRCARAAGAAAVAGKRRCRKGFHDGKPPAAAVAWHGLSAPAAAALAVVGRGASRGSGG